MVQEDVTIQIREKGAKATAKKITQVGKASNKAKLAVAGLVTGLAAFVSIRGLARIGKDAIANAAAFETYGVQLSNLLGSQEEANKALEAFTELSAKTPFAVGGIIAGATALGAAALGNREKLERLTQTAANLAAVTGLSFQEAASNLARSLSAGIGAADLFREKGVRALIESIGGIPDATKLSAAELDAAFTEIFGEGGTFGSAAEDLSATLGGALSNIGDAAANTSVALGNAFAPSVIAAARQAIIPFLQRLGKLIEENEGEIREFAAGAVRGLILAFTGLIRAGLAVVQGFIETRQFVRELIGAYLEFKLVMAEAALAALELVRVLAPDKFAEQQGTVAALRSQIEDYGASVRESAQDNEELLKTLDSLNEELATLERATDAVDFGTQDAPDRPDVLLPTGSGEAVEDPKTIAEQEAAAKRLLALTNSLRVSSAARVSALDAQVERLNQQAAKVRELAILSGDANSGAAALAEIDAQLRDIDQERLDIAEAADAAAKKARQERAAEIGGQLTEAFKTGGASVVDELAAFSEKRMEQAFGDAVLAVEDVISDVFTSAFGDVDFGGLFGDSAGALGSAFGAALGVGAGILAKELGGTSSSSRNDLVKSAVESSAATRGVVAGPTSVPVFQVGQQIEQANEGVRLVLLEILAAILAQPIGGAAGGDSAPGDSAAGNLSSTTPSLA